MGEVIDLNFNRGVEKKEILVLGDSHVRAFNAFKNLPDVVFRVGAVGGATASGIMNPDANTQARRKFKDWIEIFEPETVIIQLGEVDCGFVIWYRAQKHKEDPSQALDYAIVAYTQFISEVWAFDSVLHVIILSAPLPTIPNNADLEGILGARKEIRATFYERMSMTIYFNLRMERIINNFETIVDDVVLKEDLMTIKYINLDLDLLALDGTVRRKYQNKDERDHHYNKNEYCQLLRKRLGCIFPYE